MKWLTLFLLLLAMPALAEEPPRMPQAQSPDSVIKHFSLVMGCGPIPADEMLKETYNEIGMLEGDASIHFTPDRPLNGKMRMFVDPDSKTYTIMFEIGNELFCMLASGKNLRPIVHGESL